MSNNDEPRVRNVAINNPPDTSGQQKKKRRLSQGDQHKEEPVITQEQLALGKRLFNWRTLVPLVIVLLILVFFAQKINIDPQKNQHKTLTTLT